MWTNRRNRSRHPWRQDEPKIEPDEKLVAFRMSAQRYAKLKQIASKRSKSVSELINEVLNNKLHLAPKAGASLSG